MPEEKLELRIDPSKAFEYSVDALEREVQLVDQRLRWFLTYSGLTFTAFILSYRLDGDPVIATSVQLLLPVSGVVIATFMILALKASADMRDRIKEYWERFKTDDFPPIYSPQQKSRLGRWAAMSMPVLIGIIWAILLIQSQFFI